MRALEFITGHVIYNLAYTYKFQLKTTFQTRELGEHAYECSLEGLFDHKVSWQTTVSRIEIFYLNVEFM